MGALAVEDTAHVVEGTAEMEAAEMVEEITDAEMAGVEMEAAEMVEEITDVEMVVGQITTATSAINVMADIAEAMTVVAKEGLRMVNAEIIVEVVNNATATEETIVEITAEVSVVETVTVAAERAVVAVKAVGRVVATNHVRTADIMGVQLLNERMPLVAKAPERRSNPRASEHLHPDPVLGLGHQELTLHGAVVHQSEHSSERSDEEFHLI